MHKGCAVAGLFLLIAVGCDSGPAPLAPVSGRVTYRGIPLRQGSVVFSSDPQRGGAGPQARADIQPDGSYQLRTENAPGAVPGWYRITVVAVEAPPAMAGEPFVIPRSLLPAKYADPELSGLARQVLAGQENRLDLNLE